VWGCKQQARNADEWRKHWDLTADDDDSLSPLTRCRRVPLVHELLWLTVGWSRLANRAVRLERSLSSIERKLLWSRWQQKHGWTYQKAEFVDKHSSRQYNRYKSHRLATCLRPLNYVVLFTTITRRFKVRPYSTSNIHQLSSVMSSIRDGPLTLFTAKPSSAMQAIAWGQCKQAREAIYRCQRLKAIYI